MPNLVEIAQILRNRLPKGRQAADSSLPVVLATDHDPIPVTLTNPSEGGGSTGGLGEGAPITGQALEAGGSSGLGWLSSLRKAFTDRLPAALVNGRLAVEVGNAPAVSVSNFPATQPVTGPLTDQQIRATPVPVSVSGPVDVTPGSPAPGDYLPVRLTNGTAFYEAGGSASPKTTYVATYRLAVTNAVSSLAWNAAANADKQLATIHHTAAATKKVVIKAVEVEIADIATATILNFELRRLNGATPPATGNPAITPLPVNPASGPAEAVCLALPTTAGSESNANSPLAAKEFEVGVLAGQAAAGSTVPPTVYLWSSDAMSDIDDPSTPAGSAGGYAVTGRVVTASNPVRLIVRIIFTEE